MLLNLCRDLKYLDDSQHSAVYQPLQTFMAKLSLFIKDLESKIADPDDSFRNLDKKRLVNDYRKTLHLDDET